MVKNLVLYGFSGFYHCQRNRLQSAITGLEDTAVVLMEDAVIGTVKTEKNGPYSSLKDEKITLYCLSEDLNARGIDQSNLEPGISPITYDKLIDLIENSEKLISWL
jgi:sulfur relay protein TusB/DsrH